MNDSTLKIAIGFERYRLQVVSNWPEGAEKEETIAKIEIKLQGLEAEEMVQKRGAAIGRGR